MMSCPSSSYERGRFVSIDGPSGKGVRQRTQR